MNLSALPTGKTAFIHALPDGGELGRRLMELGFVNGTEVHRLYDSPSGDPAAFLIKGAVIALRREDAALIEITEDKDRSGVPVWD